MSSIKNDTTIDRYVFIPRGHGEWTDGERLGTVVHAPPGVRLFTPWPVYTEMQPGWEKIEEPSPAPEP